MNEGQSAGATDIVGRTTRPRRSMERRSAVALVLLFAAGWIAFIFAGSLARASDLDAQLDDARIRTAALKAEVDAGFAELKFIETPAFLEQAARSIGFGTTDEQAFALPAGAPPPMAVPVIGSSASRSVPEVPLDAWLELLFG